MSLKKLLKHSTNLSKHGSENTTGALVMGFAVCYLAYWDLRRLRGCFDGFRYALPILLEFKALAGCFGAALMGFAALYPSYGDFRRLLGDFWGVLMGFGLSLYPSYGRRVVAVFSVGSA